MPMILPATLPASAQLLLAIDPQGEIGGISATESPFSALLEAEIGAGLLGFPSEKSLAPAPGKLPVELPTSQSGKLTGKLTGNILPEPAQVAAPIALTRGEDIKPRDEAAVPFAADDKSDVFSAVDSAPAMPPAPIAVAAPLVAIAFPEGANRPAPPDPALPQSRDLSGLTPALTAPLALQTAAAPDVQRLDLPALGHKFLALIAPAPAPVSPAVPVLADGQEIRIVPVPVPAPAPAPVPQAIQPALVVRSILATLGLTRSAKPAPMASAEFEPASRAIAPITADPLPLPVQTPTVSLVALPRQVAMPLSDEARDAAKSSAKPAVILAELPPSPVAAPATASALLELAPLLTPGQGTSPAAAPAITAPAATPAPLDFTALIDRLVEARQTAQSTLAVQTVSAALTHAEFGQVSLQFRQDAEGLSVVMASADPDLARVVQVAAPAAQTGTQTGGNENHAAPRQDSTSQTPAQSQQQRGQSPQHRADDPRGSANPSPRQRGQEDSSARGGIFA